MYTSMFGLSAPSAGALVVAFLLAVFQACQAEAPPNMMSSVIFSRQAAIAREMEQSEALLRQSSLVATQLAAQPEWQPPPSNGSANQPIVNLSKAPGLIVPQSTQPRRYDFGASRSRHPRMPSATLPPSPLVITSCPSGNSVRSFNARGDGRTDDSGALLAAASKRPYIYLPPGTYRISRSITINKSILAGAGAYISIDNNAVLKLTARPQHYDADRPLFTGPGRVQFMKGVEQVDPSWFRSMSTPHRDSTAVNEAIKSCSAPCTLLLSRVYYLTKAIQMRPNAGVFSTQGGLLKSDSGNRNGVVLTPGVYKRPILLPTIWDFSNYCIKVLGGVRNVEMQGSSLAECGDGILVSPGDGRSKKPVINLFVTHFTSTSLTQHSVVFKGRNRRSLIRNSVVRINFVSNPGWNKPTVPSSSMAIKRRGPRLAGTEVVIQAVEANQFMIHTKFTFLHNMARFVAEDVVYRVEAWGGGIVADTGVLLKGKFRNLKSLLRMSGGVPHPRHFLDGTEGFSNMVTQMAVASAGVEYTMPTAPKKAAFNGGTSLVEQVMYVRAPISGSWGPGETRTYYLYNDYAAVAGDRLGCLPFRAGNTGVVCEAVVNQHSIEGGRVAVKLRNSASRPLVSWQTSHRFAVQLGP